LGKVQLAQRVLESTALELRERFKSRAIVLGNLSLAYIRLGEIEEAAAVLHQAIDVIELTWGGGGMNIAFGACRELQPWRRTAAVLDRAMALMAAT
jgi:hypothetical protein